MRWIALAIGTMAATSVLAWALVTTGHWPLDDRRQPATAIYAMNGALGQWLFDHGGEVPAAPGRRAPAVAPGATAPVGLTPAELEAARQTLRSDPRFQGRRPFSPAATGRG